MTKKSSKKSDKKIIFVCTGNTCRSPMAEAILCKVLKERNLKGFSVSSAGIAARQGDGINPKSAQVLAENGIPLQDFYAKSLDDASLCDAFAIVCMTDSQKDVLLDMRWQALRKADKIGDKEIENNVYAFSEFTGYPVMDPYGRDLECYRYVFGLLSAGMPAFIEKLQLTELAKKPAAKKKAPTDPAAPPKKRGRPKKAATTAEDGTAAKTEPKTKTVANSAEGAQPKRKRGRPKKSVSEAPLLDVAKENENNKN